MNTLIITGLILGLTSSLHCVGMCGPIAMAIPVDRSSNGRILFGALQYNFGRIITYSVLGAVVGSIGLTVKTLGILQWLSIIAGVFLILYAWRKFLQNKFTGHISWLNITSGLNKMLGRVIRSKSPIKLLFLGAINGLLPCGMVFAALLNAVLTGEIFTSALAMVAFGLGTLPSMLAVTFASNKINGGLRVKFNRVVPVLLTIVGILIILRGLNLGIPYISPEVKLNSPKTETVNETPKLKVQMDCCHSKDDCD